MSARLKGFGLWGSRWCVVFLCCAMYSIVMFAQDNQYPLQGEVVALGTYREMSGGAPVVNGTGGGSGVTIVHRTYTVKSPTRIYVLECPRWMSGFHIHSASECGGNKKIEIGDVVHFRIAKNLAHLRTDKGKEEKLGILSETKNETPGTAETNH